MKKCKSSIIFTNTDLIGETNNYRVLESGLFKDHNYLPRASKCQIHPRGRAFMKLVTVQYRRALRVLRETHEEK